MNLENVYSAIQPSIVAFGSKFVRSETGAPPAFPPLIGTGFVVDGRGVVATNRHVADALQQLPTSPQTGEASAFALVFSSVAPEGEGHAMQALPVEIIRYDILRNMEVIGGDYYGEQVPDIAFIQLGVTDVPAVTLATAPLSLRIGMEVATAGFPLGEVSLVPFGIISQATPFLRRGIVSSLLPFQCPQPHGFTIDVLSQGGASGSPIFRTDSTDVVGILHAGFPGANITFGIPASFVAGALHLALQQNPLSTGNLPRFQDAFAQRNAASRPRWSAV